jgi:hypothetical protein
MGKIVAGFAKSVLLRSQEVEDESHKVEDGALAKHAPTNQRHSRQSKSTLQPHSLDHIALYFRRKMLDAARC